MYGGIDFRRNNKKNKFLKSYSVESCDIEGKLHVKHMFRDSYQSCLQVNLDRKNVVKLPVRVDVRVRVCV